MSAKKPRTNCLNCGKECKRPQNTYCTQRCRIKLTRYRYISKWINGDIDGKRGKYNVSHHIESYFKEKILACEKCGWKEINQKTKRTPLEINHKDGNYKNNRPENLEFICPNCHALTNNYRNLNKGFGRKERRKYDLS